MKRTALVRRTPLRANHTGTRARKKPTKYKARLRAWRFMAWVKQQPCVVLVLKRTDACDWPNGLTIGLRNTPCGGVIEADHQGARGMSRKASDLTCVPLCTYHHGERGAFAGAFKDFNQAAMRAFMAWAIMSTIEAAVRAHVSLSFTATPDGP